MSEDLELFKTITQAEHHFNDPCFKIRALASTWMLATFAGTGFVLSGRIELAGREELTVLLCWAGAVGVFTLWVLDLRVYQPMCNAWFQARAPLEARQPAYPKIREEIAGAVPRARASFLLKFYYLAVCGCLLALAGYMSVRGTVLIPFAAMSGVLSLLILTAIYRFTPSDAAS